MTRVEKGDNALLFGYGIDRQRNFRRETIDGIETTTFFLGSAERVGKGSTTEVRHCIDGEVLVIETLNTDGTVQSSSTKRRFQMLDQLGCWCISLSATLRKSRKGR
jgi:hypothetical protein